MEKDNLSLKEENKKFSLAKSSSLKFFSSFSQLTKVNRLYLYFNSTNKTNEYKTSKQSLPPPLLTIVTAFISNVNVNYFWNRKPVKPSITTINSASRISVTAANSEQFNNDRLIRTKVKLFELFVSLVYIMTLFFMQYDNYNDGDYMFQQTMEKLLHSQNNMKLTDVLDESSFWEYISNTILNIVYLGPIYATNVDNTTEKTNNTNDSQYPNYILPGNLILGSPSLTQRRYSNSSCYKNAFSNSDCNYNDDDTESIQPSHNLSLSFDEG